MPDTCRRHDTLTRLYCRACGTPVCPRCSVPGVGGQRCPDCAPSASLRPTRARASSSPLFTAALVGGASAVILGLAGLAGFLDLPRALLIGVLLGRIVGGQGGPAPGQRRLAAVLGAAASLLTAVAGGLQVGSYQLLLAAVGALGAYVATVRR